MRHRSVIGLQATYYMLICLLLHEFGLPLQEVMSLYSDKQVVIFIMNNPTFYERTSTLRLTIVLFTTRYTVDSSQLLTLAHPLNLQTSSLRG